MALNSCVWNWRLKLLPLHALSAVDDIRSRMMVNTNTDSEITNAELADLFERMASGLQLLGENVFKVNAHQRVARILRELTQEIRTIAAENPEKPAKRLREIEGIGGGSAKKIVEALETGAVAEHDSLMKRIPAGLFEILKIPGLGPKSVKLIWDELGITTVEELKKNLGTPEFGALPRMGQKTIENIRKAIEFNESAGARTELGLVHPLAVMLVERMRNLPGVSRADYAGSLRRGCETIGDIDILVACEDGEVVREFFIGMPEVTQVLAKGETKCSVRLTAKQITIQCDLRIVPADVYGAALMYFTGSKEHNVRLRELAIKKEMRLNEYGLFAGIAERPQDAGMAPIAAGDEAAIYGALGLPFIVPELREDRGELKSIPEGLVEVGDIKAELHAHTTASDGRLTLDELIESARRRGHHTIAVTDHSQSSMIAGGLSPERLLKHIEAIREANERYEDITVLAGSEVDILADGSLDYDDELLAQLDVVVASPHAALRQEPAKATARLLRAIRHPLVHIIGHPTGRIIIHREGLRPDMNALFEAATECGTALEINANWKRLDLRDTQVRTAIEDYGCLIAIDTDAHQDGHFDFLQYGVMTARRAGLTKEGCINTWSAERLWGWLRAKR